MTAPARKKAFVRAGFMLWTVIVVSGLIVLLNYSATPGTIAAAPLRWPEASAIPSRAKRPRLVLFLHPKCPCSRATVAELAKIMGRAAGKISATVLILHPDSTEDDWSDTRLARAVAAIPGVVVRADFQDTEQRLFHATTSGETFVYDMRGRLQFHGGVTGARGHVGDNAGEQAVQSLALCGASDLAGSPVYGCPLRAPASSALPTLVQP